MNYKAIIRKDDLMFSKLCEKPQSIGPTYFEKIEYDKTLNERGLHTCDPVGFAGGTEFVYQLEDELIKDSSIIACRVTGSFPVALDGAAKYKVKETITDTAIVLEREELTKKPDIDLEVLADGVATAKSTFKSISTNKTLMDNLPPHRRISVGYIDLKSIRNIEWSIRSIVRWGFLRNEYVVKGDPVYKVLSAAAWSYINGWCRDDTIRFVGRLHTYYAIKNSIKYGRLESFRMTRNDDPQLFDTVKKWKDTPSELYFKEDL